MNRAGYQTVDFVLFQHQGAENHVVFQLLTRDRFGHAFVLTQFDQATHIAFANHFRIDDFNAGAKLNALGRGYAVDLIRVTQQDAGGDPAFSANRRRFHGTRFVAFRQNDTFAGFARQLGQLVAEGWRRETAAALGCRGQRFDPVGVDVVGHVFLNFLDTLVIVNRYFEVKALQAQGGLPGVGVDHEYRQAGRESAFTQLADARVHFIAAGQQNGADFHAVHCRQAGRNQHVRTVCGGNQQRTRAEVFQHVRDAARAESHGFHAAGIDIAFVDDGRIQMVRHVDRAGRDQIEAPWHCAQHRQRAAFLQLSRVNLHDFCFRRVVENFRQVRTGTALIVDRGIQFVDDNAGDAGIFGAAKAVTGQFDTLVQLFWRVGALRHHEDDFSVQRFGDFKVQRLGELMLTGRYQAFHQHHFRVLSIRVVVGNDLFHQHIFLIAGEQRLNMAHLQRFSGGGGGGAGANDGGGLVWGIATGTRLGDRFKDAQTNAFAFHSADHTEADAGQTYAGTGRN